MGPGDVVTLTTHRAPRSSQGRPAHPTTRSCSRPRESRRWSPGARQQGDLVAAGRPTSPTHGPPLHPGDLRRHRHHLPRSRARSSPTCPRCARPGSSRSRGLGEAQGRTGDDASRAARRAAKAGGGRDGCVAPAGPPPAGRRAGPRRARSLQNSVSSARATCCSSSAGTGSPACRRRTRWSDAAIASSTGLRCSSGCAACIVSSPALSFSQIRGTAKNQVGRTCGR